MALAVLVHAGEVELARLISDKGHRCLGLALAHPRRGVIAGDANLVWAVLGKSSVAIDEGDLDLLTQGDGQEEVSAAAIEAVGAHGDREAGRGQG